MWVNYTSPMDSMGYDSVNSKNLAIVVACGYFEGFFAVNIQCWNLETWGCLLYGTWVPCQGVIAWLVSIVMSIHEKRMAIFQY